LGQSPANAIDCSRRVAPEPVAKTTLQKEGPGGRNETPRHKPAVQGVTPETKLCMSDVTGAVHTEEVAVTRPARSMERTALTSLLDLAEPTRSR
jgi:hypothetical protein